MKNSFATAMVVFIFGLTSLAQQNHFEKAWGLFKSNDLEGARSYFKAATTEAPGNGEAWLMRSIIANIYSKEDEAIKYFKQFCQIQPDINPYISGYFFPKMVGFKNEKKSPIMLGFMNELIASGRLDLRSEGHLLEALAGHYKYANNLKKSNEYSNRIRSVTDWLIAGTFENISESGFDKSYEPIFNPESSSTFVNKNGAEVKWFRMIETHPGKWNNHEYHFDITNSIIYAQTFCKSPDNHDVVMRIGTSGSLKVWINDKLIFSESEERNNGMDTYLFTARLNEGYNRILLQTGSSIINRNNFLVRITDANDKTIDNLTFMASYQSYNQDQSDFRSEVIELYPEKYFKEKIAAEPENLLNYMLLAETYLMTDKSYYALPIIEEAQKLASDCSYLLGQKLTAYFRIGNRTLSSKTIEQMKIVAPLDPFSLMHNCNEAIKNEDYTEAEKLNEQLIGVIGENEITLRKRISILSMQKRTEQFNELANKAYKKYPENSYFVSLKYMIDIGQNKQKKAKKTLNKYLKTSYNETLTIYYAGLLLNMGDYQAGIKNLNKLNEYQPDAVGYYYLIGKFYYKVGLYDKAIEYFQKCQEFAPYVSNYYESEGKCYEEKGSKYQASKLYEKAIKYNPMNYELRARLRELESKKPVFSYFDVPDFFKILSDAPDKNEFPNDNTIMLCDEIQHVVFKDGGNIEKTYLLIKALNSNGIDEIKEYSIPVLANEYLIVEKAEVIKRNGSKIAAEVDYDYVVFTSLEEGDAIALIYRKESYSAGRFTKIIRDEFFFNYTSPIQNQKYSLLIPTTVKFDYKTQNTDIEPFIRDIEFNYKMFVWENDEVPALKTEYYAPAFDDVAEKLYIATPSHWKSIAEWYNDLTYNKIKPDYFVKKEAAKLFEGKSEMGDMEKAKLIYEYVTKEIRYSYLPFRQSGFVPQKASDVINTRIGDCKDVTGLFIALCREVGLKANYVLIRTRDYGTTIPPFPTLFFDHTIAKVVINNEEYFIELTSDDMPFGSLYYTSVNAVALDTDLSKSTTIKPFHLNPPNRTMNKLERITHIEVSDSKYTVLCASKKSGSLAAQMRMSYKNISNDEQIKTMANSITSDYPSATIKKFELGQDLLDQSETVSYQYEYQFDADITQVAGLRILTVPFTDDMKYYSTLIGISRVFPLELYSNLAMVDNFFEELVIKIPDKGKIIEKPSNMALKNDYLDFSLTVTEDEGVIRIARSITIFRDRVTPEDFDVFKTLLNEIIRSDRQKIVLQ
jgi:tetratricopeptide (TPR) repeat protein